MQLKWNTKKKKTKTKQGKRKKVEQRTDKTDGKQLARL